MTDSIDDCHSSEFRVRSQTWGGNEVGYRARVQALSPLQQYACYDSLNSNEDSINECNNDISDLKSDFLPKENVVKKTSRKNPWGQETYADIIEKAINSYPIKMATLQQIYDYISKNFKYFLERSDPSSSAGWKNSIRHNLSLHDKFLKCPKKNENMKSSLWTINQNCYKRIRSNSMDCKKNGLELIAKRKQLKEYKRNSASNSNIIIESKRLVTLRSPKTEKAVTSKISTVTSLSNVDKFIDKSLEFLEMDTDLKYLPPDLSLNTISNNRDHNLHEDLEKLGMNHMEPIYNYEDETFNCEEAELPNFHIAAMEYSKFVAELFIDDVE